MLTKTSYSCSCWSNKNQTPRWQYYNTNWRVWLVA